MIGVFDSGLGGLSVVGQLRRLRPALDIHYFADRGRAPYGRRPLAEVRSFAEEITSHLRSGGADMIVIACNAASAAALHPLRAAHPDIRFVGMEPAVKPAAEATRSGVIGVLTTAATFQGALFASVVDRFADGVTVEAAICDGWVELVERGEVDGPEAEQAVRSHVDPLLAAGADVLVLGCTHYPFLAPLIARVTGPGVRLVDPAPAVARQAVRVADELGVGGGGELRFECTGPTEGLADLVESLAGLEVIPEAVTFGTAWTRT
jgi:glutamate racemase